MRGGGNKIEKHLFFICVSFIILHTSYNILGYRRRSGTSESDFKQLCQLRLEGKGCANILVEMGLALRGERNDQLVEAASGLCGGMHSGLVCGCLTGAACMLALFGGREAAPMIKELVAWFEVTCEEKYGGIDCRTITDDDPLNRPLRCPALIGETYAQAKNILIEHGYDVESNMDSLGT